MSDSLPPEVPEAYLKQIKEILDHLYDYPTCKTMPGRVPSWTQA